MNPVRSHWLRLAVWLLLVSPIIALAVVATTDVPLGLALYVTLSMWVVVCVILALIALAGLIVRLIGRGMRALRR